MEDGGDKQQKGSLYIMFVEENTLSLLDMALTHMVSGRAGQSCLLATH